MSETIDAKEARELFDSLTLPELVASALASEPSLHNSTPENAEKLIKFMQENDMSPSALTTAFYNVIRVLFHIAEGANDAASAN